MDKRKTTIILATVFFMFCLVSATPTGVWTKTKDEYVMSCINIEPVGVKDFVEWKVTYIDYKCLSKMLSLELTGETSKIVDDLAYVNLVSKMVDLPIKLISPDFKTIETSINLDTLIKDTLFYTYSTSYNKIAIGLATEEWELIYYENVTVGLCDSGVWSQYNNCTPSANWTVTEKQVYANMTSNETYWKINGTLQNYSIFQIWSNIHLESYDKYIYFNDVPFLINVTTNILTTNNLIEGEDSFYELVNEFFETQTVGNLPTDFSIYEGIAGTIRVSNTLSYSTDKSLKYIDTNTGTAPTCAKYFSAAQNNTLISLYFYVDSITSTGDAVYITQNAQGGYNDGTSKLSLRNDGTIHIYPNGTPTELNLTYVEDIWYNLKTESNIITDKVKYWLNDEFMGEYATTLNDVTSSNALWLWGGATPTFTVYYDNLIITDLNISSGKTDFTSTDTYEIGWTTGWAYCTENSNCTQSYYCDTTEDVSNYKCVEDLTTTSNILNSEYALEGPVTLFSNYLYDSVIIPNATGVYSIGYRNGTFIEEINTTWNEITSLYENTYNFTIGEYEINVTFTGQPFYHNASTSLDLDVIFLELEILNPKHNERLYASTVYPALILTIPDFYLSGSCRWIHNTKTTTLFTVTNNATFDNFPLDLINNDNILTAECVVGDISISKSIEFITTAVPDPYLLGINLNTHLVAQAQLEEMKQFLFIGGTPYMLFMIPISIIMMFGYLFIRSVNEVTGLNKGDKP